MSHVFFPPVCRRLSIPALAFFAAMLPARAQDSAQQFASDRLIVRFAEPVLAQDEGSTTMRWTDSDLEGLATRSGVTNIAPLFPNHNVIGQGERAEQARALRSSLGLDAIYILTIKTPVDVEALGAAWSSHPKVVYAEPDFVGSGGGDDAPPSGTPPDDEFFDRQWGLDNTGSNPVPTPLSADADVNAPEAWTITTGNPHVVIAVLDSGLKLDHPDIAARVWTNSDETENTTDDDANGYVDDVIGWDFVNDDNDPTDDFGHGTNVAGILGAIGDNQIGYSGIDRAAQLMILKILDDTNSGLYSWWSEAITYAVDNGARVLNMSVGGSDYSASMQAAVDYAHGLGAFLSVSMMNTNNSTPFYPAAYANTVAVGATNGLDERAVPFCWGGGSNYGSHIDLVAPGEYVYGLHYLSDTDYESVWCGTSMATSLVAGGAALMLALDPTLGPEQLRTHLRNTAQDMVGDPAEDTPGFDIYYGEGRLDVFAALTALPPTATEPESPSPLSDLAMYPNPFKERAHVTITLATAQDTRVEVFDGLGRLVEVLHQGALPAGSYTTLVEASQWASGVYLIRITGENFVESRVVAHTR